MTRRSREEVEAMNEAGMRALRNATLETKITSLRAENERLREAVQLLITTQEEWERSVEKIIGKQPNVFLRAIDSARAALEGVTKKEGEGNERRLAFM